MTKNTFGVGTLGVVSPSDSQLLFPELSSHPLREEAGTLANLLRPMAEESEKQCKVGLCKLL